ncbi:MAG: hypothetical protein WC444_04050 [Candidatus Paceibacterota bacterium]
MQVPPFFSAKKSIIIETLILCAFLGGMYYLYTSFSEQSPVTTSVMNEKLLGANFTMFSKAIAEEPFAFDKIDFLKSDLVMKLKDFSETISPNETRGRLDPFIPYASSRPIR